MDFLDQLFDPTFPIRDLLPERMYDANLAKVRPRLAGKLRGAPLGGERVRPLATLIGRLGVARVADTLREVCADPSVPAINRAAPAYLLLREDLDPRVAPDRLPDLAESLLLGCAILDDVDPLGPLLAALFASDEVDPASLVARLERWRLGAIAPVDPVYREALLSPACARAHAAILAAAPRHRVFDDTVREAAASGALDQALAEGYLARAEVLRPAEGRAWVGPRCDDCGGRTVTAIVATGDGHSAVIVTHLHEEKGATDTEVTPFAGAELLAWVQAASDDEAAAEIPLGAVIATAAHAYADSAQDVRALCLFQAFSSEGETIEEWLLQALASDHDRARAAAAVLGDDEGLEQGLQLVLEGLGERVYSLPFDEIAPWVDLLEAVLARLEAVPLVWGQPVAPAFEGAWHAIDDLWAEAADDRGLSPEVTALIPQDRADHLAWREILAAFATNVDDPYHEEDVLDALAIHGEALERLGYSAADAAHNLGAPEMSAEFARLAGLSVGEPLANALEAFEE